MVTVGFFLTRAKTQWLRLDLFKRYNGLKAFIPSPEDGKRWRFRNVVFSSHFLVTLRLKVSQSVCLYIEHPCGTCDQILLPVGMLLSEICGLVSVGRPLWWEDGSAVCSVITQWSESRRTRNHTLLSHLRLLQPGGPGSRLYIPQEQGGPVIPLATGYS
jgi:hypothetical protein